MNRMKRMIRELFILPVHVYRLVISPLLPQTCRHMPTCSEYMIAAIREWGVLKGGYLGLKRLSKCHPWGSHGIDPVPRKTKPEI